MKSDEMEKIIYEGIKTYPVKPIKIQDKVYNLSIFSEDEDLNLFEGFLFAEIDNKNELSHLISKYQAPVSGYVPRLSFLLYNNQLLIKDYRRNKLIRKTLEKINKPFISKLKKAISEPNENNLSKLFDRTDIIEEFYILYKKARDYLLKNIKGISEEGRREEFVDNFMMQMLTLWYLQEREFFDKDTSYFITKFNDLKQKKLFNGFNNYYEFLTYFFEKICNHRDSQYYEDSLLGKVVVVGPAIFLNGGHDSKAISIPDKCFYKEGMTEFLIDAQPKKVSQEVPLLNLFESRDWTEGNIDEFVLGAIYEKLITYMERKKLGAYYTPEEITSYICKNTIEPYLVDRVNEKFNQKFETIDQITESDNKEILLYLFKQLKEIKILDPAVGSAHFLESAINVLLSIYEKIQNKVRELGIRKGFEIIAADEQGKIKNINLLEISDEEQFKLYVKFFIILSKNIYGVDINPSALKVAKARLFLTLAKHFDAHKNYFIRFPNVHFNLREGNSLIGYTQLEREKEKAAGQLVLDLFVKKEEATYITEAIKIVSELKEYIKETAKALGISGNVVKDVEKLNEILSKEEIKWIDFQHVLKTKENLIRILIASLNSQYARPLNELINQITELFNQKLDDKFAKEHNIDLAELKQIKTFHWIFEFPEVFLDRGGFDVVVGNPPYGNTLTEIEKDICHSYASFIGEIASVFVERGIPLNKENGYFSFIITYAITFSKDLSNTRNMIYENYKKCVISTFDRDKCRFFQGMTQSVSIMLCKEKSPHSQGRFYTSRMFRIMPEIDRIEYQLANDYLLNEKVGVLFSDKHRLPKIGDGFTLKILKKLVVNKSTLRDLLSNKSKDKIWIRTSGNYWYNAWDREPYQSTQIVDVAIDSIYKDFLICLINSSTYYLWFRIYGDGRHMTHDIMGGLPIPQKEKIINSNKVLCCASNILMNILFYNFDKEHSRFNTSNLKRILDVCDIILGKLYGFTKEEIDYIQNYERIIRGGKKIPEMFDIIIDYMLFDCQMNKNLADYNLIDSLIYELYFKEKFCKDGVYSESKEYLLELVSKHLKPINYDRWAELYWKKQLEGKLKPEEEQELEMVEKKNLKTIEEVYDDLKNCKQIQEQIGKIRSHPWIKIIKGET